MTSTLAVIGAGNIGSRHIQGLAGLPESVGVHVVDPSPDAVDLARTRYREAGGDPQRLTFRTHVAELPSELDVAIVATVADRRRAVVEELVNACTVRHLVLEKILFQRLEDYGAVADLLAPLPTKVWVNLARRLWDLYARIVHELEPARWIDYRVSGSAWDLGCNSIHFLDHVAWIAGDPAVAVDTRRLDADTVSSKRAGYREFTGTLDGDCGRVHFQLTSLRDARLPVQLAIDSDVARFVIYEDDDDLHTWAARPDSRWLYTHDVEPVPLQSNLTGALARRLLETGDCPLPTYEHASTVHQALIEALLAHLRAGGHQTDQCPIT